MSCRCKKKLKGYIVLAFGCGVSLAAMFPSNLVMLLLAVTLILLGVSYLKCE